MNNFPSQQQVARTRLMYPPGTRIELIDMPDDPNPIPSGARGEVRAVDDAGQLIMKWDNGRSLSLIPGIDQFRRLTQQELMEEQGNAMGGMSL